MAEKTIKERVSLYDGSVQIDYYPSSHRYKLVELDGKEKSDWLKSPSSIVDKLDKSQSLIPWALSCYHDKLVELVGDGANFTKTDVLSMIEVAKTSSTEKKESAASIGTVVHDFITKISVDKDTKIENIEGYSDLSPEEQARAISGTSAYLKWFETVCEKVNESEFIVYSKKEQFVGRCDGDIISKKGERIIVDYKTSSGIYTSQVYQVASYLKAKEEENPSIKYDGALLAHFYKEDKYDKDNNLVGKAGDFGYLYLTRGQLVTAYKVFKALQVVAENDYDVYKIVKDNYQKNGI